MKFNNHIRVLIPAVMLFLLSGCTGKNNGQSDNNADSSEQTSKQAAPFSADSAYRYIQDQVAFGPRVPETDAHRLCGDYIAASLKRFGADVTEQSAEVVAHGGKRVGCRNIIGSYNPEAEHRILLMAHWDTRPTADQDPNMSNRQMPILGADDGGSGVGVLLELARQYGISPPGIGIDMLFFDVEDMGTEGDEAGWCLGSTYWAQHPHKEGYKASFGILLDMVGSKGATFMWELYSKQYAPMVLSRVWDTAARLGYGNFFVQVNGGLLTDDHLPVNRDLGVPSIDIVNFNPNNAKGFGDYWHTLGDNMEVIDTRTLTAVGHTVATVIRDYKPE